MMRCKSMCDTKSKQDYHTKTQRKTSIQESKLPSSKKGSKHPKQSEPKLVQAPSCTTQDTYH